MKDPRSGHAPRAPFRLWLIPLITGIVLGMQAPFAQAAPVSKPASSLSLVPEDAAFYSAQLRNRERYDRVVKSKAFARLMELPAVQFALAHMKKQYNAESGELTQLRQFFSQAENKELLAVLIDAVSNEIFMYGSKEWTGFVRLYSKLNQITSFEQLKVELQGNPEGLDAGAIQGRAALRLLAKNLDLIKVPNLVVGFRLKDTRKVEKQLRRLETILKAQMERAPKLKNRLKRVRVGDNRFLTLQLDGSLVPWEEVPFKDLESKPGEFDQLKKKLKSLKFTLGLGVRDGYLMLSLGSSTDHLAKLGKGKLLADRPELKPLSKAAGKPLIGVSYTSKAIMAEFNRMNIEQLDALAELARIGLNKSPLPEKQQTDIANDLDKLARELEKAIPEPGAVMSFAFLTKRGSESYIYNYGTDSTVDASQPLTLLKHVGGNPILAAVGRSKNDLESYQFLVKWAKVAHGHFDKAVRTMTKDKEELKRYEDFSKALLPVLKRLDQVTQTLFFPAFDGQFGLVVDARWSSNQWHNTLPVMPQPMPMLELGMVMGIKDAAKVRKAASEYRKIINEVIDNLRKAAPPGNIPPGAQVPAAQVRKTDAGTLYSYPVPKEAGLDAQVKPTAGLSDSTLVMSLSHAHAMRLLKATPLKVDGGPLSDPERKLAGAMYFNFPVFVDAATPWVQLGVQALEGQLAGTMGEDMPPGLRGLGKQAATLLEVMKCYKGSTTAIYIEGGAIVSHTESVCVDLK